MDEVSCIGYRSWNRIRNCGDAIGPYIVELISGLPAVSVTPDFPHVLPIGSVFALAGHNSHVWGAGYLNPTIQYDIENCTIHAVRGEKTVSLLRDFGIRVPDAPLGDPGIFANDLLSSSAKSGNNKFRAAFVPHHGSIGDPLFKKVGESAEFTVVNVLDDSLRPIELIAQSEVVISQSLHGLIFAESLGKPNLWISNVDSDIWEFKFRDWFTTTVEPQTEPILFSTAIDQLVSSARLRGSKIDKQALASAFPTIQTMVSSVPVLDFRSSRRCWPATLFVDSLFAGRLYLEREILTTMLRDLSKIIFPTLCGAFSRCAERGYCVVTPSDERLTLNYDQAASIARYLDENAAIDFAFVIDGAKALSSEWRPSADGFPTIIPQKIAGGAVFLRPDSYELSRNFVTFCV